MAKHILSLVLVSSLLVCGCSTGRDYTSEHYLPEWENRVINFPVPSETSGGMWVRKSVHSVSRFTGRTLAIVPALLGNVVMNAYYIPTWPFRWLFRGDKRLIVWYPIFGVGEDVGSDYYSKEWNQDLV